MAGKILVTGATGNTGGEIVRLLKEKMSIIFICRQIDFGEHNDKRKLTNR